MLFVPETSLSHFMFQFNTSYISGVFPELDYSHLLFYDFVCVCVLHILCLTSCTELQGKGKVKSPLIMLLHIYKFISVTLRG